MLYGVSLTYLVHIASIYTQLPGLIGQTGLEPIVSRPDAVENCWFLQLFPSPEMGAEVLAVAGMVVSLAQLVAPAEVLMTGFPGVATYTFLWFVWHDLVVAGGRFTSYQMDTILLDAAPIVVIASSGLASGAATFGFRWLLTRLYIGAGAVKLLSCDASWRNLSALHWHFQSQPLPNPIATATYLNLPQPVYEASTLASLVVEMGSPFLFLAPSCEVRLVGFIVQAALQTGILLSGNYGPFNAFTLLLGVCLFSNDDLPPLPGSSRGASSTSAISYLDMAAWAPATASVAAVGLCAVAIFWTLHNTYGSCVETLDPDTLVYSALLFAPATLLSVAASGADVLWGAVLLLGSAAPFASGLGVSLPLPDGLLGLFNVGAHSYGLFAVMTGVGGRPTMLVEAATDPAGPWSIIPFRYQVMEPSKLPPLCFPHFPRMDWTHWFTPFGQSDGDLRGWLGKLLRGFVSRDESVLDLLDRGSFERLFPAGQAAPEFVRVSPMTYKAQLPDASGAWWSLSPADIPNETAWNSLPPRSLLAEPLILSREDLLGIAPAAGSGAWPSTPVLRAVANGGGESFIYAWLVCAAALRSLGESPDPTPGSSADADVESRASNADSKTDTD
eukprot:TRINITY_DN31399_c0_g1_i10.p1 TRINITY_DN31399_c0_g1~~TRINITY_DN31399_c0_g1_i10.p1  ORF type:complete len:615 (+),score=48.52 TRINITY_DN31399_c0_g1_i10:317-2161(+)